MPTPQGVDLAADVMTAQHLVDSWIGDIAGANGRPLNVDLAELRGMIVAALADVREAAYLEGALRGRRDIARTVRDALDGEGA